MLRNNYILKYNSGNNSSIISKDDSKAEHNDNRKLYHERPLEPAQIKKIKNQKIFSFVDNIMCNKKINNLLYSTNAKSIASYYIKQKKFLLKQHATGQISSDNLFRKKKMTLNERIKKEAILEDIKDNIEIYRKNRKRYMTQIVEKDDQFIKSQPKVDKKLKKISSKSVNEIILQGYKRAFDKCLKDSLTKKNFEIIKLNTNDVYGRLYNNYSSTIYSYNTILNKNKNKNDFYPNKKISRNIRKIHMPESDMNISAPKRTVDYKIKSNISNSGMNQFSSTISKRQMRRCCSMISGGPKKIRIKKKINSFKENLRKKFNHKILSFKKNGDKNDLSLFYTMVVGDPFMKKNKILNKNYRDKNNNSSLQIAVKQNSIYLAKYFLDKKNKNINSRNNKGQTALHIACSNRNEDIINLLVKNGANTTTKDLYGYKPYDYLNSDKS